MILRPATMGDEAFLLALRNDPVVRANSWTPRIVGKATHHRWLLRALKDDVSMRVFVVSMTNRMKELGHWIDPLTFVPEPVIGTGRLHRDGDDVEFSIALCPEYRGKGLGHMLIDALLAAAPDLGARAATAKIRATNLPSLLAFLKNGFVPHEMLTNPTGRWLVVRRTLH